MQYYLIYLLLKHQFRKYIDANKDCFRWDNIKININSYFCHHICTELFKIDFCCIKVWLCLYINICWVSNLSWLSEVSEKVYRTWLPYDVSNTLFYGDGIWTYKYLLWLKVVEIRFINIKCDLYVNMCLFVYNLHVYTNVARYYILLCFFMYAVPSCNMRT